VPRAIEVARSKANVEIDFRVIDFLKDVSAQNLPQHSFSNEDRQKYMKNLEYLIKPGGLYIQICFSEKETRDLSRHKRILFFWLI